MGTWVWDFRRVVRFFGFVVYEPIGASANSVSVARLRFWSLWRRGRQKKDARNRALVKGFTLSYHDKETVLLNIDPYYGNLS